MSMNRAVHKPGNVTILIGAAESTVIGFEIMAGGKVLVPAVWTAANIGFNISTTQDGTFVIAKDKSGVPIQISGIQTALTGWYDFPPELYSAHFIKLFSKSTTLDTETGVNQAATRTLEIMLKS